MTVSINGTTGISGVDGSASTPALQGADTNTGISFGVDEVAINTGGVERVKVDSAGDLEVKKTSTPVIRLNQNDTFYAPIKLAGNDLEIRGSSGQIEFYTGAADGESSTERMRITDAGAILVNSTSALGGGPFLNVAFSSSTNSAFCSNDTNGASGAQHFRFFSSGSQVGNINTTTTATAYATSSDYRLKENVTSVTDGITRLQQLKPARFNFIADPETTVDGFLAHEVQDIVPEAITGKKDAMDDEGNPIYQGIDQSKLVPLLTAALQEAIAKIETLETKVAALEGGAS